MRDPAHPAPTTQAWAPLSGPDQQPWTFPGDVSAAPLIGRSAGMIPSTHQQAVGLDSGPDIGSQLRWGVPLSSMPS